MTGRVEGKIALIAGAGSGIGRACMILFGGEGAKVVGCSRTQANLDETLSSRRRPAATASWSRTTWRSRKGPRR